MLRNSAPFDVPDSSPSFILTPFVTKAQNGTMCKSVQQTSNILKTGSLAEDDGDGDGDDGRIFPQHPSPILHAPREDNPTLRSNPPYRDTSEGF